ncbi:hypothetical protein CHM34_17300 [Paludifilum halophilum]|uniref:Uncharacterized protein n=1 Tax=Paludifilum halophilum TaxID=1642702 RepID=A0A235B1N0_9BACL|nr:hypothetical protein CHM34_17300 [Paludifilum halophilum]
MDYYFFSGICIQKILIIVDCNDILFRNGKYFRQGTNKFVFRDFFFYNDISPETSIIFPLHDRILNGFME